MSRPEVDPTFLALPFRSLGEVALARATELGATHADFRFERVRFAHCTLIVVVLVVVVVKI